MSIFRMPPLIPSAPPSPNLSSLVITRETSLCHKLSHLSIKPITHFHPNPTTIIRMGGGPRTFPGGVSKWQWKRMQSKKQKQLLKARLCRERQIYEMRKRAELRAAVTELERPWEVVERAPTLFSVSADEQLKVLADRFHKPGGYDLWSDRDGPQLFQTENGLPSARFFPKGAVHSVKPYGIGKSEDLEDGGEPELSLGSKGGVGNGRDDNRRRSRKRGTYRRDSDNAGFDSGAFVKSIDNTDVEGGLNNLRISGGREQMGVKSRSMVRSREGDGKGSSRGSLRNRGDRRNGELGNSYKSNSKQISQDTEKIHRGSLAQRGRNGGSVRRYNPGREQRKPEVSSNREVFDMSLKLDGSYELQSSLRKNMFSGGFEDDFELD